ncbi:hypothetical protein GC722_13725 [Auraticoccus sp. F435]|uniref:Uncharacterized protein n=1 Tax=Auraticoccus cholistanensis TaxID=2656650 RepID=A0A6A9UZ76_9ACTN|nr:hypothetical protein [Auraticoccus cholistanensis]MVA77077.1 hypothetical protein [Auraticoccus cholistanensis]
MRTIGYAYPWDLTEDPRRRDRILSLGVDAVAVAGAYHAVRAATPSHPRHRVKDARHAAFYRPVEPARFQTLVPAPASWTEVEDAFGEAVATLHAGGTRALAWTVLTHSSELGERHPDHTVVNAFGEGYPWALCGSSEDVVELAAALVGALAAGTDLDGFVLEALGHLGFEHGSRHDKTMSYTAADRALLSICFAPACRALRDDRGDELASAVRAALGPDAPPRAADATLEEVLAPELAAAVSRGREAATERMASRVAAALPAGEVHLHASPDVHSTGPFAPVVPALRGLGPGTAVAASAWGSPERIERQVRALAGAAGGAEVGAYLTVLEPGSPPLAEQLERAAAAGATTAHVYHLGLCSEAQLDEVAAVLAGG